MHSYRNVDYAYTTMGVDRKIGKIAKNINFVASSSSEQKFKVLCKEATSDVIIVYIHYSMHCPWPRFTVDSLNAIT